MKKQYRKRPVIIEAIQWTGENTKEIEDFAGEAAFIIPDTEHTAFGLWLNTLEGLMFATPTDMIIKGVDNEFYPCKYDIFCQTYEEVNDETD